MKPKKGFLFSPQSAIALSRNRRPRASLLTSIRRQRTKPKKNFLKKNEIRARSSARELVAICSSSNSRAKNAYSFDSFPSALENNGRSLSTKERARSFFFLTSAMDCAFFQKACLFRKPAFFAREESDYLDILASSVAFLNLNERGTGEEKAKKRGTRKRRRTRFFPRSVIRVVLMCRYYYYHVAEWLYFIRLLLYTFTPARARETYVFFYHASIFFFPLPMGATCFACSSRFF